MPQRPLLTAAVALLALASAAASAQAFASGNEEPDSRFDVYAGYAWHHPINSGIAGYAYQEINRPAATLSLSYFFNRYVGTQVEGGYFSGRDEHKVFFPGCTKTECDQLNYTAEAGLIFRYPVRRFVPFLHTLGGGERYNGPVANPLKWGWGVTGGIGLDYVLPWFNDRLAVRPVQADWQYSQVVYGPLQLPAGVVGGFGEMSAVKLSGGMVLRFGDAHTESRQLALGCSAQPSAVYAGDPVTVTTSTIGLDMSRDASYSWETNGGAVAPKGSQVTVDTMGLRPGQYTVIGHITQGSRARRQASCDAVFTVRALLPPMVLCSANPSSVRSGTPVTIRAVGTSPENRPLTYSYGASGGSILPSGSLASLNTDGLPPGAVVTATCNVVDDLGQHASATADVNIAGSAMTSTTSEETEHTQTETASLCSVRFERDRRRPTRVDNEGKACLDDIALSMNRETGSQLLMIGNAVPGENARVAQERAVNAKRYLTTERGVDAARIRIESGHRRERVVENILVPAGAIYDDSASALSGTTTGRPTRQRTTRESHGMRGVSRPPADATLPSSRSTSDASPLLPPLQ